MSSVPLMKAHVHFEQLFGKRLEATLRHNHPIIDPHIVDQAKKTIDVEIFYRLWQVDLLQNTLSAVIRVDEPV